MSLHHNYKKINPFSKQNNDTGFGSNANEIGGRFINKDGTYNLTKEGMSFIKRMSIFHDMLNLPVWKFITVILLVYLGINLSFTAVYFLIGAQEFAGLNVGNNWIVFKSLFYFSTQTYTTVGYGHVYPVGDAASLLSSIEALSGFLSLAVATGLIY